MDKLFLFRSQIDIIDELLIDLVSRRIAICKEVAHYKKGNAIPMMQAARVEAVLERAEMRASRCGLAPGLATELYKSIIQEACRLEDEIIGTTS